MFSVFKTDKKLVINGADTSEKLLIENFIAGAMANGSTITITETNDINADINGLTVEYVTNALPEIQYFPQEYTVIDNEIKSILIQTLPTGCTFLVKSEDESIVGVTSGSTANKIAISGAGVGTANIQVHIKKDGYQSKDILIPITVTAVS